MTRSASDPRRIALLAGASAATILLAGGAALAQSNPMFIKPGSDPAAAAARAAASNAARQSAQAAAIAQRSREALNRANTARQSMEAAQAAARAAAIAAGAGANVPDGLGRGGLQVADGVVFDPGSINVEDPRLGSGTLWVGANGPTQTAENGRTVVEIDQTQQQAILTWETFNVGRNTTVRFDQSAGGANVAEWSVLNRINDPSGAPSQIFGNIEAQGQVYLINRNGVVFGATSQVNVRSLTASALDFYGVTAADRDKRFLNGIVFNGDPQDRSVLVFGELLEGAPPNISPTNPNPVIPPDVASLPGEVLTGPGVVIEAGARLHADNGRIMLIGQNITNNGAISANDGEVVLAAGRAVYLNRNYPRGFQGGGAQLTPLFSGVTAGVNRGGLIQNNGSVVSNRGVINFQAKNITQNGLLQASTSVLRNGAINLTAGDGIPRNSARPYPEADRSMGRLTFTGASTVQILPDDGDGPAVGFDQYQPSQLDFRGRYVTFESGSTVFAPSAEMYVLATRGFNPEYERDPVTGAYVPDPRFPATSYLQSLDDGRIYVDRGATINLGGLRGVEVAMERNSVRGELRAAELQDNPLLRDSWARGREVFFDSRYGTGLANMSGWLDLIERDVSEFMTTGGSLQFNAPQIITREGSTIDLSGGSLSYLDGYVRSTLLVDRAGNVVPIELADPNVQYVGFYGDHIIEHSRWGVTETFAQPFVKNGQRFERGYVEGRSAGSLTIGPRHQEEGAFNNNAYRVLQGDVVADVVVGQHQREAPTGASAEDVGRIWRERPQGAQLALGWTQNGGDYHPYFGGNITIGELDLLAQDFRADTALDTSLAYETVLSKDWFDGKTFTDVNLKGGVVTGGSTELGGRLTIGEGVTVDLGDFGSFRFAGRRAEIDGVIRAAGGDVYIETAYVGQSLAPSPAWRDLPEDQRPSLRLGSEAVIDVAGRWVNDFADVADRRALAIDGGAVTLMSAYDMVLEKGSVIDVSGGGQLQAAGRTVTPGDGGSIVIQASAPIINYPTAPTGANDGDLVLDADMRGYALGRGGSLSIGVTPGVVIGDTPVLPDGVLPAGQTTDTPLVITQDLTLAAGTQIAVPFSFAIDQIRPGEPTPVAVTPQLGSFNAIPQAPWVVPPGLQVTTQGPPFTRFNPGQIVPAGTVLSSSSGTIAAGYVLPANVFPEGMSIASATVSVQAGPLTRALYVPKLSTLPTGSTFAQPIEVVGPVNLGPELFDRGGFAEFQIAGRQGVTVQDGTRIAPRVESFVLNGPGREIASGARLSEILDVATAPEALSQPMSISLGNFLLNENGLALLPQQVSLPTGAAPGAVRIGTGAVIDLAPESTVDLYSESDVFIDGVISTLGGDITARTVNTQANTTATVRLGANARLLAGGYQKVTPDGQFERRSVEAGGSVVLGRVGVTTNAARVIVLTDEKSVVDVSGVQGVQDLLAPISGAPGVDGPYVGQSVDGAAGSISIMASGAALGGDLNLAAGGEGGRGGLLNLAVLRGDYTVTRVGAPTLTVTVDDVTVDSVEVGDATPDLRGLRISADQLNGSGADHLSLKIESGAGLGTARTGVLAFEGDVTLNARGSISLGGPMITQLRPDSDVVINAGHVEFNWKANEGSNTAIPALTPLATNLSGSFTVNADLLDVRQGVDFGCGSVICQTAGLHRGFSDVTFNVTGDIRLNSERQVGSRGRITTGGRLNLNAAQVYGTTSGYRAQATDPGYLIQAGQSITITSNGNAAPVPFSFGERLTLRAPEIVQAGVLRAPLGEIRLEATEKVTLAPGSLTSTSLGGLRLPIGIITAFSDNNEFNLLAPNGDISGTPNKTVSLTGPDVAVEEGAVIDVSGGGDLYNLLFVPGNGGSSNILERPGMFAIVPSVGAGPSPVNGGIQRGLGENLRVGDRVYLSDVPGLPPGEYTLLPAIYASMDGGMLIQAQDGGFAAAPQALARPDGAHLVGGYRVVDGRRVEQTGYDRFLVMPKKVFSKYSELIEYSFNDYVARRGAELGVQGRAGLDAGSVVLGATRNLVLDGEGRFNAAAGGLLGNLDISAQRIAVVGEDEAAAPDGYLAVDARKVSDFGAGSIFIGGVRSQGATGTTVTVNATDVLIANNANAALVGPEILLGARNTLTVKEGAVIRAEGPVLSNDNPLLLAGNGALVRASTGDRVDLVRTGANGSAGVLDVRAGSTLAAAGSLSLDGSRSLLLSPTANLDTDKLDLSSVRVAIGDVPDSVTGTVLSGQTLANLSNATDLLIRGIQGIDLYGDFTLGGRDQAGRVTLGALTFDTPVLNGVSAAGETATIVAGRLTLRNGSAASTAAPVAGGGALAFDVDELILGPGEVDAVRFSRIDVRAGRLTGVGRGGFDFAGPMTVATDLVTAAAASDYALRVGGDLSFTRLGGAAQTAEDFGGRLSVEGRNISIDTTVALPAGVFEARATGGDLALGRTAFIDATGQAVDFRDVTRVASGGLVRLGATGNVAMADGARIDVSGDARGGDAGWVEVDAGGRATLGGDFIGRAADGYRGGGFVLEAGSLSDFAGLNTALEAGGLSRARLIQVDTGDLALAAGQTITAHDVLLRADGGRVTVAGSIDADGDAAHVDGGRIRLVGGNGVELTGTARLDARAAPTGAGDFEADSGFVEIAAAGGRVNVASGAVVDVSGGRQGGGEVLVRADRVGTDIAIDRLDGRFVGARDLGVAGVRSYQATTVTGALRDAMFADAAAWMGGAAAMKSRIGAAGFEIRPGLSVESAGDLTIATDIDLSGRRYGAGATGYLDFVAGGDILINGNISDGFAGVARTAALNTGRSWSYGFEAGRDVAIGAGRMVRTGTGDIRIDAGRDLVFGSNTSVLYTAGSRTTTAAGFTPLAGRVTGEFPTLGGDIVINAGRDIVSPVPNQSASAWLFRYGDTEWTADLDTSTVAEQTSWSIVFANFEQGVGALGGGNVEIAAGRDIDELVVALPTTGHMTTAIGGVARDGDVVIRGGGDLSMRAGRDVEGGVFMLGRGQADVEAGGALTVGETLVSIRNAMANLNPTAFTPRLIGSLWGLADATLNVEARSGVEIEGVFDPMLQGQICQNSLCNTSTEPTNGSAFFGMTNRTSMQILSAAGDLRYNTNPWASVDLTRGTSRVAISLTRQVNDPRPTTNVAFADMPGDVDMAALDGDIVVVDRFGFNYSTLQLAPSDGGNAELLAAGTIRAESANAFEKSVRVIMRDVGTAYRRGYTHAFRVNADTRMNIDINVPQLSTNYDRGFSLSHRNDDDPARFYAMGGTLFRFRATLPKAALLYASEDVNNVDITVDHDNDADLTTVVAGRDTMDLIVTAAGIGDVVVEAGGDLNLGFGRITSAGQITNRFIESTRNLALPEFEGANIYMLAGAAKAVDYDTFLATYLDPANSQDVVRTYLPDLRSFMKDLGYADGGDAALLEAFAALPLSSRKAFAQRIFFTELKETGLDVTDPDSPRYQNYERGYEAIKRLFPLDTEKMEDKDRAHIILNARSVETHANGDITMLAPYGRVDIGGLGVPATSSGGVITRKGGDIRIMADQDIALFSSRVFTLLGGDITMWTSNGDITAGVGAKTSIFRPPLVYNLSNSGVVSINVFGLQTGAGIGVLDAGGTGVRVASRMDLIAPRGEVNAGDAGIRVVGDLNIAALRIVGLDNIQVTGEATGLPEIIQVNTGALTAASSASSAVTDAADELVERSRARPAPRDVPSIITVEVLGFGD